GVAMRAVAMAQGFQLGAQRRVVVDLAVVGEDVAPVRAGHGLVAAGDVHDREPAHAEAEVAVRVHTLVVGTTVDDRGAHRAHDGRVHGAAAARVPAGDPAHAS